MNDDFLHRIRVEPPPDFLARLKSRLDLQPPPRTPALGRTTLRKVAFGLLFGGAVFAITLMTLNRGTPDAPVSVRKDQPHAVETAPANLEPNVTASRNSPAAGVTAVKPVPYVRSTTTSPMAFTFLTPKALAPYLIGTYSADRSQSASIVATDSTSDAIAELCGTRPLAKPGSPPPLFALTTRRMTTAESDSCAHSVGKVTERAIGHQAIVLARSRLYGTFALSPAQIFLALAAEIPDPARPGKLMSNPNTMWNDVDSGFEREPIEFFGPDPSSPVGMAFREILFEAGCHALPAMTAAKECPNLRKDGIYVEASAIPDDMLLKLQTRPNAIGILVYGYAIQNTSELTVSPIESVVPTRETISSGAYPGARPLFLYINEDESPWLARYVPATLLNRNSYALEQFAVIPPERSQP